MESTEYILSPADALAFIRKARGKVLFVTVGQTAPIADRPGYCFPIMGNIRVTRTIAWKFIVDAYGSFADRGAMVAIRTLGDCLFIGRGA